uniref:Uncharacterized protein n=1 Tax=Rhizophagus irregularis (strain DAOM 181602 / DAOM 197198 / MUCL 43194) TaxID=747089 RepID=U9TFG1_RHIID
MWVWIYIAKYRAEIQGIRDFQAEFASLTFDLGKRKKAHFYGVFTEILNG